MNKFVIYKYPLQLVVEQYVPMPVDAQILCVQMQGAVPTIWAGIDPQATTRSRKIQIVGTGHGDLHSTTGYVGTVQDGPMVWHVFDRGET